MKGLITVLAVCYPLVAHFAVTRDSGPLLVASLILLTLSVLLPALSVPREVWFLFANLLNYVIIATFFVIEYVYRRYRFPQRPYPNIFHFIRRALAVVPRALSGTRERA